MTHQKAFEINVGGKNYGTFAEIGGGQEVARWFFRAGGAAGTVAKTMSAYDMAFSDAIYGPCPRYVSRQRLQTMLDHEYHLLLDRLENTRGATTHFFVFANTVATRSYSYQADGHGWMGIRFQTEPRGTPSQIIIHVRMLDKENVPEQEALGIIGVNLVYGAFHHHQQPDKLIASLLDELGPERLEVDMIKFDGPAFSELDNRLMSLQLLQLGLAQTVMFGDGGGVVQPAEVLHNQPILLERGNFRPMTRLTQNMIECARAQFQTEPEVKDQPIRVLLELSLNNLLAEGRIDPADFLARVDMLAALNYHVLLSRYGEFYRLVAHLSHFTRQPIGIAMGVPNLQAVFEEKYYADLEGGLLEAFGRLFKKGVKIYVHPWRNAQTGELSTADNFPVAPNLRHIRAYLRENHYLEPLRGIDEALLDITPADVYRRIQAGDPDWETMVPSRIAVMIKKNHFFGYRGISVLATAS